MPNFVNMTHHSQRSGRLLNMLPNPPNSSLALPSRRRLLAAAALLPLSLAPTAFAQADHWNQPRTIWMQRSDTSEQIRATYWADGELIRSEYYRLCHFMRDLRMEKRVNELINAGQPVPQGWYAVAAIDTVLLDILYSINGWLSWYGIPRAMMLNSGFRHPVTNAQTEGADKDSRHMYGGAGDLRIPGVSSARVGEYGIWLRGGGVGFYPSKDFVHVDAGRLRSWRG
jgi:uncharacterized protein YcbK (DUF882 family)